MRRNRLAAWRGAFSDFAAVPVLVLLSFAVRAVVSIRADQIHTIGSLNGARRAAAHIVGKQASSSALQAVATGLVSVTSITFSVQLLAVQRTASNVSV